jgi:hypothetical protein
MRLDLEAGTGIGTLDHPGKAGAKRDGQDQNDEQGVIERPGEAAIIAALQAGEEPLTRVMQASAMLALRPPEQQRAHHRRGGKRHHDGDRQRGRDAASMTHVAGEFCEPTLGGPPLAPPPAPGWPRRRLPGGMQVHVLRFQMFAADFSDEHM